MDSLKEDDTWFLAALVISIVIAVIIIFVVYIALFNQTADLNEPCNSATKCIDGLTCENGICKSNIGGSCSVITDCVSSATACHDGICIDRILGDVGDPCPCNNGLTCFNGICKAPIGAFCNLDLDCISGQCMNNICTNRRPSPPINPIKKGCIYDLDGQQMYSYIDYYIVDITSYGGNILLLTSDGLLIMIQGNRSYTIRTGIHMDRIYEFNRCLYGIDKNGKMYTKSKSSKSVMKWKICEWAPDNITHMSKTSDENYLWLQCSNTGYLYSSSGDLVENVQMNGTTRCYGALKSTYLEIDCNRSVGTRYPLGDTITNCSHGELLDDGDVIRLDKKYRCIRSTGNSYVYLS